MSLTLIMLEMCFENKVNGDFIYGFTDNYVKTKIKFNKKLVGKECNVLLKKLMMTYQ